MATTHTISRRKPATYGKPSSRPLSYQLSSSAFNPSPPNIDVLTPQSGTAISKPRNIDSFHLPHDRGHISQQAIPAVEPKKSRAGYNNLRSTVDHDSTASTVEGITAWEISSSDDAETSVRSGFTRARKRRRIVPPHLGVSANKKVPQPVRLTDDDGSLSPIAASNDHADLIDYMALHPSSSQALTDSLHLTSLGASMVNESRIGKPSAFQARRTSNSHTTQVPRGKVTLESSTSASQVWRKPAALATSLEASKEQCRSGRRKAVAVPTLRDSEWAKSISPPTLRTPTRPRSSVESTTPHQRALWDMLLPESNQGTKSNPVNYSEPELKDRSFVDHVRTAFDSAQALDRGTQTRRKPSRRGRIIDRLQPVKRKQQGFVEPSRGSEVLSDSGCEDSAMSDMIIPSEFENSPVSPKDKRSDTLTSDDMISSIAGQHGLLPGGGLKVTYSTQRSHLANECLDDIASFDLLLPIDGAVQTDASLGKRARKKAPAVDTATTEDPRRAEFDCSQNSSMRTIHELRESGENVRQLNDLETLFDDLDGSGPIPTSLRRSKLFELVRRLQEPASCRLLLDQGYDRRLHAMSASRDSDAMTDILYATAMLYLVAAPFTVRATSRVDDPRTAELFATRLTDDQDLTSIAQSRRSNMSKRGQSDLKECVDMILHSSIWRSGAPTILSGRMIGLQGLEYLVRKGREAGRKTQILSPRVTGRVVGVLPSADETSSLLSSADQALGTQLAVSILESCTISGVKFDDDQWTVVTLAPLLAVLSRLNHKPLTESEETRRLVLRLYLNLTNNNPRLCQEFAGLEVIQSILHVVESHFRVLSDTEQRVNSSVVLDTLILALGTLINLVEWSWAVRHTITSNADTGECFLAILVRLFVARRKAAAEVYSEEEISSNVAFGYLSVLLAYLCVDGKARVVVTNRLGGEPLQQLLDAVEEFLQYHRQIDEVLETREGETDLKASFVGRLESVLSRLRDVA
ncbi:MAG: hypothetical protein Q9188_000063 [Gyalolechia gomerana]